MGSFDVFLMFMSVALLGVAVGYLWGKEVATHRVEKSAYIRGQNDGYKVGAEDGCKYSNQMLKNYITKRLNTEKGTI